MEPLHVPSVSTKTSMETLETTVVLVNSKPMELLIVNIALLVYDLDHFIIFVLNKFNEIDK
jgi:hypothetical protein